MNLDSAPTIQSSIVVHEDMSMKFFLGDSVVPVNKFVNILNNLDNLLRWSELENLISSIRCMKTCSDVHKDLSDKEMAISYWEKYVSSNDEAYDGKKFILEQMKLHEKSKMARRYTNDLIIFAYSLYMKSSSCYTQLQDSSMLALPTVKHLSNLTSILQLDNSLNNSNAGKYLQQKFNILNESDKTVNLQIDEIHVKKSISYKGRTISGFAENKLSTEATTVQTYMISSIFSAYKEVFALIPVNNMNADYLRSLTCNALQVLEDVGFTVITIISDNNRINRNMFKTLGHEKMHSHIPNPANNTKKLYILFDPVHLFKSIRNNWINQLDSEKTFCCPDFNDSTKVIQPKFSNFRKIYNLEKSKIIKASHKLSFKSLYPSSLDKQSVQLVVNIFHESNDASLQRLGEKNSLINWKDTLQFIQLIRKWWNIFNVSHLNKGHYLKCNESKAFSSVNDERLIFLRRFSQWLEDWKNLNQKPRCGCLTEETFFSLHQTTYAMVDILHELLSNGSKFILTSKFQTDNLEYRFSKYRQMSGGNYYISVQQILESERKIKLKSLLQLHSHTHGEISLKNFVTDISGNDNECGVDVDVGLFSDLITNSVELVNISQTDIEILTYIAGYCASKIKTKCTTCINFCLLDKELQVETSDGPTNNFMYAYLDIINRGGLKYPTENIVLLISVAYLLFQSLINEKYEKDFVHSKTKQHQLLTKIILEHLQTNDIACVNDKCSQCECPYDLIIIQIMKSFSNICLNNYVKNISSASLEKKEERKLKKFKK